MPSRSIDQTQNHPTRRPFHSNRANERKKRKEHAPSCLNNAAHDSGTLFGSALYSSSIASKYEALAAFKKSSRISRTGVGFGAATFDAADADFPRIVVVPCIVPLAIPGVTRRVVIPRIIFVDETVCACINSRLFIHIIAGRQRRPTVVVVVVVVDVESSDAHRARNRPAMMRPRFDDIGECWFRARACVRDNPNPNPVLVLWLGLRIVPEVGFWFRSRLKKERDGCDESGRGTDKSEWIKMNDNGVNNE